MSRRNNKNNKIVGGISNEEISNAMNDFKSELEALVADTTKPSREYFALYNKASQFGRVNDLRGTNDNFNNISEIIYDSAVALQKQESLKENKKTNPEQSSKNDGSGSPTLFNSGNDVPDQIFPNVPINNTKVNPVVDTPAVLVEPPSVLNKTPSVPIGEPPVVPINTIDNPVDEGLHGVTVTLATKVYADGAVELKTAMAKASTEDTNKALSGETITNKKDFKTKLYQTDKAVGDEFNNIHNKDYETTTYLRTIGTVPSGMEILNMLRRHGKLSDATYRPIIDAVLKSYNNRYDLDYNKNDTNWINDFAAKEAYYKFIDPIKNPSFFAKEQAFQFSKKDNMGIIDSVGNAGTLAMGVAGSAGAAVASLAKTDLWTPFKTILDGAIKKLGNIDIKSKLQGINLTEFINSILKNKSDDMSNVDETSSQDVDAAINNDPAVKSYMERIRSLYDEFNNYYTENVVKPIQESMNNVTMPTIDIKEIKTNIHNHITQLIERITKNRGELTMLNAGEVIVFSPFLIVGGLATLGSGAVSAVVYKSAEMSAQVGTALATAVSDKARIFSEGLSERYKQYEKQISETRSGRKQSACNAILDFINKNRKLDSKIILALLGLWNAINIGTDAAIEWKSEPGDIIIRVENTPTPPSANLDEIVNNLKRGGQPPSYNVIDKFEMVNTQYNNIKVIITPKKQIVASKLLSKYCPLNCIAKLASGSSRTLDVITENLQKITVLENGAPQWIDSFMSLRNYEYNGIPATFIYALMKRRFSGYTKKITQGVRNTFSRGYTGLKGIGSSISERAKTLKNKASDFYKRFTKKNQDGSQTVFDTTRELNSTFGGKRNKHSKRVAKNKQNKRKTRRH